MADRAQTGIPVRETVAGPDGTIAPAWVQWLEALHQQVAEARAEAAILRDRLNSAGIP